MWESPNPEGFAHVIPDAIGDLEATPLLCAGAVGYRALSLCRLSNGQRLGLTGFGASGHLVLQMAQHLLPELVAGPAADQGVEEALLPLQGRRARPGRGRADDDLVGWTAARRAEMPGAGRVARYGSS